MPSFPLTDLRGSGPFPVLTEAHAGRTFYLRSDNDPVSAGEQIANDFRHAYRIGFRAPAVPDGKWHSISLSVTVPAPSGGGRVEVRSKKGYFALK